MNMPTEQTFIVNSVAEMEAFAAAIGARLIGGEAIELISDLGGGKTTFTRGLAQGAGSEDVVSSPTFTVSKIYDAPGFEMYHFDFYRLQEAGLIEHELTDLIGDPRVVIVVEWGGIVQSVLPPDTVKISITKEGETSRKLTVSAPEHRHYLFGQSA